VYLYFDNKEALFKAMVREAMVPAIQRGEQLIDQHAGSSRDLIEQLVRGWWKTLGEARASGLPKLIVAEAANFPELARFYHQEVVQRGRRVFSRAIERGVRCGEFRPVDVEYLPRAITASILAAAIWKHSIARYEKEPFRFERFIDALIDLALNGLLAGERPHA
jgi:AcrR family transcriptional regulator